MKPEPRKRRPRGAAECSAEPAVLATVVPVAGLGARRMEMLTTAGEFARDQLLIGGAVGGARLCTAAGNSRQAAGRCETKGDSHIQTSGQ